MCIRDRLYVRDVASSLVRPEKELKAFGKIALGAGETGTLTMTLSQQSFAFYNPAVSDWVVESGDFELLIGASSADIRLKTIIDVESATGATLNITVPLGTLMNDEHGLAVLAEHAAELLSHPMLDMAKGMTLKQLQQFAPDQLTDDLLSTINEALQAI